MTLDSIIAANSSLSAGNTSLSAELKSKNSYIENLETKLGVFNDRLTALDEKFNTTRNNFEISSSKKKARKEENDPKLDNVIVSHPLALKSFAAKKRSRKGDKMFKILSTELADLVHAKKNEVMKYKMIWDRLWNYITTHKIRDPKDKRMFTPDEKLKPIFGKDKISRRSMNKLIESHILKML